MFLLENYPNIDFYNGEIYLHKNLSLDSEVFIFDCNEIEGLIYMDYEGEKLVHLFSIDELCELYQDFRGEESTNEEIGITLINYRINDA